jgi:uncharacterized membrane protein YjgN (DUF898 family)
MNSVASGDAVPVDAGAAGAGPAEAVAAQAPTHRIEFTGEGGAYFRVWIVNLVLTILTLGIYSAWAKVRRLRYFYGNTLLDGSPFEFHGSPWALLKGRVVAVLLLLAYSQSAKVSLSLWLAVVAVLVIIFPWLLWKSMRFRLANSSYRGIRFSFVASLREVYQVFAPPMLVIAAIGASSAMLQYLAVNAPPRSPQQLFGSGWMQVFLATLVFFLLLSPWFWLRIRRLQHGRARLGSAAFECTARASEAYGLALLGIALYLLFFVGAAAFAAGLIGLSVVLQLALGDAGHSTLGVAAGVLALVGGYAFLLGVLPILQARAQNLIWGRTRLDGQDFVSEARGGKLWVIAAQNLVLVLVTLGLFWPYAVVRMLRYRAQAIGWRGDPAVLVAQSGAAEGGATGDESVDLLGFDLGL